jgi:ABC-type lipoprotein export system ATPase subunit
MTNVLETIDVVKRYSLESEDMTILHGTDLAVRKGEMMAIVGPSGSGKSTLMHIRMRSTN